MDSGKKLICNFDGIEKVMKNLYCEAVLPVLLYGEETWNLTNHIKTLITSFHNAVERDINRRSFIPKVTKNRKYEYIDWSKLKQKGNEALTYTCLMPVKEYWSNRLLKFRNSSLGCVRNNYNAQNE